MTKGFYRVSALIHATAAEADALQEQLQRLLCPEPDHAPPRPIPWETMVALVDDGDDTASLQQQIDAEGDPGRRDGS